MARRRTLGSFITGPEPPSKPVLSPTAIVRQYLQDRPQQWVRLREIVEATGLSMTDVNRVVSNLVREDRVDRKPVDEARASSRNNRMYAWRE